MDIEKVKAAIPLTQQIEAVKEDIEAMDRILASGAGLGNLVIRELSADEAATVAKTLREIYLARAAAAAAAVQAM